MNYPPSYVTAVTGLVQLTPHSGGLFKDLHLKSLTWGGSIGSAANPVYGYARIYVEDPAVSLAGRIYVEVPETGSPGICIAGSISPLGVIHVGSC